MLVVRFWVVEFAVLQDIQVVLAMREWEREAERKNDPNNLSHFCVPMRPGGCFVFYQESIRQCKAIALTTACFIMLSRFRPETLSRFPDSLWTI